MNSIVTPCSAVEYVKSPRRGNELLRLDLNENPYGCSPGVLGALGEIGPEEVSLYPDTSLFRDELARAIGITPECLLLTNGADEAIRLIMELYPGGGEVILVEPTFSMYPVLLARLARPVVSVPFGEDMSFPVREMEDAIGPSTGMVVLVNPNNPTGTPISEQELMRVLDAAGDAYVLLDEAYIEFHGESALKLLDGYPRLMVVRTFSKAMGLAGLRLGYVAADSAVIEVLESASSPYNVNRLAVVAARAALADREFVADTVARIRGSRARMTDALAGMGLRVLPSSANFITVDAGSYKDLIWQGLRERGILVRDLGSFPRLSGCMRISIGTGEQCTQVLDAIGSILGGGA